MKKQTGFILHMGNHLDQTIVKKNINYIRKVKLYELSCRLEADL